jgi:hypothetical protein
VKKKEKNRRGKRAIVVCKGKIFFPEREIQEEEEEEKEKKIEKNASIHRARVRTSQSAMMMRC